MPVDTRVGPAAWVERTGELRVGLQVLLERLAPTECTAFVLRHACDDLDAGIAGLLRTPTPTPGN